MISMDIETLDNPGAVPQWSYGLTPESHDLRGLLTTRTKSGDLFGEVTVKSEPVNDFGEEAEQSLLAASKSVDENCTVVNYISCVNKQLEPHSPKSVTMAKAISPKDLLKIQCIICKEAIVMQKFQRHIASCGKSNRAMQDVMEMRLKQILCNFNVFTQRKVNCMLQKEVSESASNNRLPATERRIRRDSAKPDYQSLRRGRSKSVFKDTRLNSTEPSRSNLNGISNSVPTTPVSTRSRNVALNQSAPSPNWPVFGKPSEAQSELSLLLQNSTFSCSLCSYTTDRKTRLTRHEWTHRMKKAQVLQCFYCSQRYTIGALAIHIRQLHTGQAFRFRKSESSVPPLLACSKCPFQCQMQIQLNDHLRKVHDVASKLCAAKQLKVVLRKEDLEALKRRSETGAIKSPTMHLTKSKLPDLPDKASFKCTKCDFVTTGNVYYSAHLQTHAYQQNLKCECGFESTRGHLRKHKLRCAVILAYGKTIKNRLKKMPTVQKARPKYQFSCKLCSAQFTRMAKLYLHMKTHQKNQPIEKCGSCDYQSTHRSLLRHIKTLKHYTVGNWRKPPNKEKSLSIGKSSDSVQAATKKMSPSKTVCLEGQKVHETNKTPNLLLYGHGFQPDQSTSPKSTATAETDEVNDFSCKVEACYEEDGLDEPDQDGLRLIKCTLCSYFSTNEVSYKRHVDSHISRNFPLFKCQFCTFTATRSNFRYHRSRCAGFRKTLLVWKAPQKYMLHCAACSFTTYFPEDLNKHIYSCTNQMEG